ncbi:MAG: hypothetical protein GY714_21490 [Desulfobacterales bacterium]|nr:hypothetical protein [Desulfobacterales bacterium]MCP4163352.1 hypothetical protein [Deltaproteobacteria bacterium]
MSYKKLEMLKRSDLILKAAKQVKNSYSGFNISNFPHISVQKNGIEILVTFFHHAFLVTGNEGKIYQVSALLISGSVSNTYIQRPFGAKSDWPWPYSDQSKIDYSLIEFYAPNRIEKSTINKVYFLLKMDKSKISHDTRVLIFENFMNYGVVITDGYWTGFSLFNKLTGSRKEMGYMDVITTPPEHPWQYIE